MRKLVLVFIMLICLSCGKTSPIIDSEKPFIVTSIEAVRGHGMAEYYGTTGTGYFVPSIILPVKMYNIGDTISFKKKHLILK